MTEQRNETALPLGEKSWATTAGETLISTRYRESSALVSNPPWYFETFAFRLGRIVWESWAYSEAEAHRQHDIAARWFARTA